MTWKQFFKLAAWVTGLLIGTAWLVFLFNSYMDSGFNRWQKFVDFLPVMALFSVLVAIVIPPLLFAALHIGYYAIWWKVNARKIVKGFSAGTWWALGLWLGGAAIFIITQVIDQIKGSNFGGLLGMLLVILAYTGAFGLLIFLKRLSEFRFIEKSTD
ncbi:MAG: hypothetical protein COB08_018720 [Rhodobacteraceae bacterium]|nr:hypothetical protein [Paracoccaceae bacterium]